MCPRNCSHPVVGRLREVAYTYLLAVSISLASRAVAPSRPSRSYQLGQPAALPAASKAQPCRSYLALSTVLTREIVPGCRLNSRPSGGRLRQSVRSGRSWRALRSWKLRPTAADAGWRRPVRRSRHVDRTGTETGHMAGTNAGDIRGVRCRPQARQFFAAVRRSSACWLCAIAGCSL